MKGNKKLAIKNGVLTLVTPPASVSHSLYIDFVFKLFLVLSCNYSLPYDFQDSMQAVSVNDKGQIVLRVHAKPGAKKSAVTGSL